MIEQRDRHPERLCRRAAAADARCCPRCSSRSDVGLRDGCGCDMAPQAAWIAPVIRPVTSSGLDSAIGLSATLRPRRMHHDAVADREHVRHAVADQHDRDARVAQPADQVQHLGHLPHPDRGGRLVHQHDARVGQAGAGDRHRLALPARHLPHESRGRVSDFSSANSSPARSAIAGGRAAERARRGASVRGPGTRWPRPSDCCTARGPGRRPRCPSARASTGLWKCTACRRCGSRRGSAGNCRR